MWKLPRLRLPPKADDFEPTARELETRAHRLTHRPDHTARDAGSDDVVFAIAQFVRVLGKANAAATGLTWAVIILTVVNVIVVIGLAVWQTHVGRVAVLNQNDFALNTQFYGDPDNKLVIAALDNDTPILKENGGTISDNQMDLYLGSIDTIDNVFEDEQLTESDLCDDFSHYLTLTYDNLEIQRYIADQRKADPRYYAGLDTLRQSIIESKDPYCREPSEPGSRAMGKLAAGRLPASSANAKAVAH